MSNPIFYLVYLVLLQGIMAKLQRARSCLMVRGVPGLDGVVPRHARRQAESSDDRHRGWRERGAAGTNDEDEVVRRSHARTRARGLPAPKAQRSEHLHREVRHKVHPNKTGSIQVSRARSLSVRKFDSLALENEADQKSARTADDNKNQAASESLPETETKTKRCTVNRTSGDSPANPSVDSSTDTLIPNNDSVVPVANGEKEV